ncbi:MAG: glycosyltransferase family 39 protein, partial [Deltaproteobacteria bacterium]|nr:glycosyltransferase family 39 protein [Deltaproteobacteria bacterium]
EPRAAPRRDARTVVALLAVWALGVALVDLRGDFPLNDDWAYGLAVRRLLDEGVFRPPGWAAPTLLSQALWGAAAALPGGFSYTALRLSTLLLGGLAIAGVYGLARALHARRGAAALAALTLGFGPVFFDLAHTFMTDVPFVALAVLALLGFARALEGGGDRALAVGCAATVAAVLCRQTGLLLPIAFAIAQLATRRGGLAARLPRALLPLLLAGAALGLLRVLLARDGGASGGLGTGDVLAAWQMRGNPPAALRLIRDNLFTALLYCGLFLAPALLHSCTAWRAALRRPRVFDCIAALTAAGGLAVLWAWQRRMPLRGNVLIESGLGPITLHDVYIRGLPDDGPLPAAFWLLVTAIAIAGAALLTAQLAAALATLRRAPAPAARRLLLLGAAGYLAAVSLVIPFDRYYLPLVALLAAALAPPAWTAPNRVARGAAVGLLAAMAAFSVAATHDYLSWNRARWQALAQLAADGVAPERIDGGPEFTGPHFYRPDYRAARGKSWWWVADDEFIVSMGPLPGYAVRRRYPYARWLPTGAGEIMVLQRSSGS